MKAPNISSGQGVTNRGVHFQPLGYHPWIDKADEWIALLKSMHISWVVLLSEGDAVLKPEQLLGGRSVVQLFLDNDIRPVVRFAVKLDRGWPVQAHVEELVRQFAEYGLTPLLLIGNEPGDPREYASGKVPNDWPQRYAVYFSTYGSQVVQAGGIALFADGPGWPYDPFPSMESTWAAWEDGWMGYGGHWYGLNRPPDYPRDSVTQTGKPTLIEQDLKNWFGPFYTDKGLNDVPVEVVNAARRKTQPGLTPLQDPTCWRGWEQVADWMTTHFGRPLLMCLTEGGWTPGAIAGSGTDRDLRFLRPTPDTVANWTLEMFQMNTPLLFQCPWLLGDSVLGGAGGWDGDGWCTGAWRHGGPDYWYYMPVIRTLQSNPPDPVKAAAARVAAAQVRIGRASAALDSLTT